MAFRKFIFMPIPICRECKKTKKNSKFETEDKSNGNPLLHHFFFPPLQFYYENSEIFPTIFFSCPLSISRKMNGKKRGKKKKTRNLRGKTRAMETHFYTI